MYSSVIVSGVLAVGRELEIMSYFRTMVWLGLAVCFFMLSQCISAPLPWTLRTTTGCYGNTADDFLRPVCNQTTPSSMAVVKVMCHAKLLSTGCPYEATVFDNNATKCCTINDDDCDMDYVALYSFYTECHGRTTCTRKVTWMNTECNGTDYLPRSNYMSMDFYCIPDSQILQAKSSDNSTSGTAVYIQNQDYPDPSTLGGNCTVSSTSTIVVTVLHLSLHCNHYIFLEDGDDEYIIHCGRNNDDYQFRTIYTSTSNSLTVTFPSVNLDAEGHVWIEFSASDPSATVQLSCGVSPPIIVDPLPNITSTTTNPNITTSVTGTTTAMTEHTASITTRGPRTALSIVPGEEFPIAAVIVPVVLFVIIGVVTAAYCIHKEYKKKKGKIKSGMDSSEKGQTMVVQNGGFIHEKDTVFILNEHGLPFYPYGDIEIIEQKHPLQTRLSQIKLIPQTKKPRLKSAPKPFGHVQTQSPSSLGQLPEVRGPPKLEASGNTTYGLRVRIQNAKSTFVTANTVYGDVETSTPKQKRKKKKKKAKMEGADEEPKKRKKKKRKKKKNSVDVEDDKDRLQ